MAKQVWLGGGALVDVDQVLAIGINDSISEKCKPNSSRNYTPIPTPSKVDHPNAEVVGDFKELVEAEFNRY